jgi:hypothetical protein
MLMTLSVMSTSLDSEKNYSIKEKKSNKKVPYADQIKCFELTGASSLA